LSYFVFAQHDN